MVTGRDTTSLQVWRWMVAHLRWEREEVTPDAEAQTQGKV